MDSEPKAGGGMCNLNEAVNELPEAHREMILAMAKKVKDCLAKDPSKVTDQCINGFLDRLACELLRISFVCPQKEAWCMCFLVQVQARILTRVPHVKITECPYTRWARVKSMAIQKCKGKKGGICDQINKAAAEGESENKGQNKLGEGAGGVTASAAPPPCNSVGEAAFKCGGVGEDCCQGHGQEGCCKGKGAAEGAQREAQHCGEGKDGMEVEKAGASAT